MRFDTPQDAIAWLDKNTNSQKATYVNGCSNVWIGDFDDLPRPVETWIEVSRLALACMAEDDREDN